MIVKWNQPNILTVYKPGVQGQDAKEMVRAQILPGNNVVADADWAAIKKHPLVKHYLDAEVLEEFELKGEGLKSADLKAAKSIVAGTYDVKLLAEWKSSETRKDVLKLIDAQFAKIEKETKKETPSDDDED